MRKSSRCGNFSSKKKFDDITYQRDFESGGLAAMRGKHSSECPFKLPDRREAWLKGFRGAIYENTASATHKPSKSAQNHIERLREQFNIS